MKPRIIISSYDDIGNPTYGGGGAIAVDAVAKRLAKHYQVTVMTGSYPGAKNITRNKVSYVRLGSSLFGPKIGQLLFQLCLPLKVLTYKYDLWIESFTPPFSTAFLPLFTTRPVIGLVHMLAASDMERKYNLPFKKIENLGLKLYRHFIVLSESSKAEIMIQNKSANYLVEGNGVEMPVGIKSYAKRPQEYLLFMGRIEVDQKGLDLLLIAFKQIIKSYPLRLKIAGSGSPAELAKLDTLINDLGLASSVDIVGRVSGVAKDKLYQAAKLVLIPSRYETFSLTALESLSYGIPLVCFDIPGMSWLDPKIVAKAKEGSAKSYASKILKLLSDPSLAKEISTLSIATAKKYTWNNVAEEYHSFIREIL